VSIPFGKVWSTMGGFSILTKRSRAVVALVHSVVCRQIGTADGGGQSRLRHLAAASGTTGAWILCGTFAVVSSILLWLLVISRGRMEEFYFGFCTVSASSGLL
jgi:hypothetical protein